MLRYPGTHPEKRVFGGAVGFGEVNPKRLTGGELGHLKANEFPPCASCANFAPRITAVKVGDKVTVAMLLPLANAWT
jgi:hypothetical protein